MQNIDQISWTTVAVSAGVLGTILGLKIIAPKFPGALLAVIGAIFISWNWDLAAHGVATLGPLPSGLPSLGLPHVGISEVPALIGTAASIFVLVLAQSAATSRAYAAKYNDHFDENVDLVGLERGERDGRDLGNVRGQRQSDQDADGRRRRRPKSGRAGHDRGPRRRSCCCS